MRVLCINDTGWLDGNKPSFGPKYMEECMVMGERMGWTKNNLNKLFYILAEYYIISPALKIPYAYEAKYFIPLEGFDPEEVEETELETILISQI